MFFASFESMVLDESKHWLQRSLTSAQDSLLLLVSCSVFSHAEFIVFPPSREHVYFSCYAELTFSFLAMQSSSLFFPPCRAHC